MLPFALSSPQDHPEGLSRHALLAEGHAYISWWWKRHYALKEPVWFGYLFLSEANGLQNCAEAYVR